MCSLCLRTGVVFVQLTFNDHTHNMLFAVWHFKFKFSLCAAYLNRQQQLLLTVQTQHKRRRRQSRTHTTGNAPITPHSLTTDYDLLQRCGKTIHSALPSLVRYVMGLGAERIGTVSDMYPALPAVRRAVPTMSKLWVFANFLTRY